MRRSSLAAVVVLLTARESGCQLQSLLSGLVSSSASAPSTKVLPTAKLNPKEFKKTLQTSMKLEERAQQIPRVFEYEQDALDEIRRLQKGSDRATKNVETFTAVVDPEEIRRHISRVQLRERMKLDARKRLAVETGAVETPPIYILEPRKFSTLESLVLVRRY